MSVLVLISALSVSRIVTHAQTPSIGDVRLLEGDAGPTPSLDLRDGMLYVGSVAGTIYAVELAGF